MISGFKRKIYSLPQRKDKRAVEELSRSASEAQVDRMRHELPVLVNDVERNRKLVADDLVVLVELLDHLETNHVAVFDNHIEADVLKANEQSAVTDWHSQCIAHLLMATAVCKHKLAEEMHLLRDGVHRPLSRGLATTRACAVFEKQRLILAEANVVFDAGDEIHGDCRGRDQLRFHVPNRGSLTHFADGVRDALRDGAFDGKPNIAGEIVSRQPGSNQSLEIHQLPRGEQYAAPVFGGDGVCELLACCLEHDVGLFGIGLHGLVFVKHGVRLAQLKLIGLQLIVDRVEL